jgi:DNA-binding XRE family transcriptional regulator/mannose-6-phosphate isomerase-like protein (cupin superfamily)
MSAPVDAKETQSSFGAQVRAFRAARRLTAAALAERCGVSRSLISQIETGRISPSLDVVRRLAGALGVPIAALFGPEGGAPAAPAAPAPAAGDAMAMMANGAGARYAGSAGGAAPRVALVRRDERKGLRLPKSKITYELLSPDLRGLLQVQWVELAPGERAPAEGFVHRGEECYVVLQGTVRFRVADQEFVLHAGDALTFDSSLPHGASNDGPHTAVALSAMTPPSF